MGKSELNDLPLPNVKKLGRIDRSLGSGKRERVERRSAVTGSRTAQPSARISLSVVARKSFRDGDELCADRALFFSMASAANVPDGPMTCGLFGTRR